MWTREQIKNQAKDVLRICYWESFAISLVLAILNYRGGNSSRGSSRGDFMDTFAIQWAMIILFSSLIFLLLRIAIGYALEVGGMKFFIQSARQDTNMGYLGYAFKDGRYLPVVGTLLVRGVIIVIGFFLLIIPGIIASYVLRFVPYILADNPKIGLGRALELSNQMTKGEKFNIFVLDLSFIGWYLLGLLACGIGVMFVNPYRDATSAQLYLILRENAIGQGYTTYDELNMVSSEEKVTY